MEDGRTCFFFPISDFSSLFLQAFQQSSAASLLGPRSGNPGYIVGKPLLSLTDDISHAVSFLAYCSLMRKLQLLIFWIFQCKVPHFLGIQDFLYQTINTYVFKMFKKLLEKLLLDHDVTTVFFHSFRHCEMAQNNSLHPLPLFPNIPDRQKRKITVMILLLIIILVYS